MYLNTSLEQTTTQWSGGTTTQLCIYPFQANLGARDFDFRISTASVEVESSTFSKFVGFHRVLMILEGSLTIHHANKYAKHLHAFDSDEFDGEWDTSSEGKVVDFNVIYSRKVKHVEVEKEVYTERQLQTLNWGQNNFIGFYVLSGSMKIGGKQVKKKDFMLIEKESNNECLDFLVTEDCTCIAVYIQMQ
jgi:uncharacterized protein